MWIAALLIVVVAAVAAIVAAANSARRESEAQAAALRQEMQALLAAQSQAVTTHLGQLAQSLTTQLGQVAQHVQTGMASSGALASGAQKAVAEQLQASTEMLGSIRQQLGEVQQAGHDLSGAARQIESVLGGAKTRGTLGEAGAPRWNFHKYLIGPDGQLAGTWPSQVRPTDSAITGEIETALPKP